MEVLKIDSKDSPGRILVIPPIATANPIQYLVCYNCALRIMEFIMKPLERKRKESYIS